MTVSLDAINVALRKRVAGVLGSGFRATIGTMPATPDAVATVNCYQDPRPANPDDRTRQVRFQVRVRQSSQANPPTANQPAESVQEALLGHGITLVDGMAKARITHLSTAFLGSDDQGRDERTDNYLITTSL